MPDYMILQQLKKLKVRGGVPRQVCPQTFAQNSPRPRAFTVVVQNANYESVQQTAQSIAEQAHVLAYDPNYMSPFAQFACANGLNVRGERVRWVDAAVSTGDQLTGLVCAGGKPDDITVLLSIVAEYTD